MLATNRPARRLYHTWLRCVVVVFSPFRRWPSGFRSTGGPVLLGEGMERGGGTWRSTAPWAAWVGLTAAPNLVDEIKKKGRIIKRHREREREGERESIASSLQCSNKGNFYTVFLASLHSSNSLKTSLLIISHCRLAAGKLSSSPSLPLSPFPSDRALLAPVPRRRAQRLPRKRTSLADF